MQNFPVLYYHFIYSKLMFAVIFCLSFSGGEDNTHYLARLLCWMVKFIELANICYVPWSCGASVLFPPHLPPLPPPSERHCRRLVQYSCQSGVTLQSGKISNPTSPPAHHHSIKNNFVIKYHTERVLTGNVRFVGK